MKGFLQRITRLVPNGYDDPEKRYFKTTILFLLGIIILMVLSGGIAFILTLESEEQTLVPDLVGMELENALISLEERALIPGIQLRYSQNPKDKGLILGQDPNPGTSVKAGSRVVLNVSKGSAIERLDNYVGWNLDNLEAHLKSMVSIYGPLLEIQRPVSWIHDESPAGTILEQKPEAGFEITSLTTLDLVVSRGPAGQTYEVLDYLGMPYDEVIQSTIKTYKPFVFRSREARRDEVPGTVVSQSPSPGSIVPVDTILQFEIARPEDIPEGYVFGIIERTLPEYDVPVSIRVESVSPAGDETVMFSTRHAGGLFTVPYQVKENTVIRIIIAETEVLETHIRADREF